MESRGEPFEPVAGGLPCMNCKKPVSTEDAKIFGNVFVCSGCYTIADRQLRRLEQELRALLLLATETIRLALIEGRMQLPDSNPREIPKSELLRSVIELAEKRERGRTE